MTRKADFEMNDKLIILSGLEKLIASSVAKQVVRSRVRSSNQSAKIDKGIDGFSSLKLPIPEAMAVDERMNTAEKLVEKVEPINDFQCS